MAVGFGLFWLCGLLACGLDCLLRFLFGCFILLVWCLIVFLFELGLVLVFTDCFVFGVWILVVLTVLFIVFFRFWWVLIMMICGSRCCFGFTVCLCFRFSLWFVCGFCWVFLWRLGGLVLILVLVLGLILFVCFVVSVLRLLAARLWVFMVCELCFVWVVCTCSLFWYLFCVFGTVCSSVLWH